MGRKITIGIDPGKSGGGFVVLDETGFVDGFKMPPTMVDIVEAVRRLAVDYASDNPVVYMEKVGTHRFGNSAKSSLILAENVNTLRVALYILQLPVVDVPPTKWMTSMVPGKPTASKVERREGETDAEHQKRRRQASDAVKKASKDYTKNEMARLYPKLKVTNWMADALAIATYGQRTRP